MEKVEYYWLEDLVDKIEIDAHLSVSCALSESENDDRTITVFWKFGLKTIVPTGLEKEKDNPRHIQNYIDGILIAIKTQSRCILPCIDNAG